MNHERERPLLAPLSALWPMGQKVDSERNRLLAWKVSKGLVQWCCQRLSQGFLGAAWALTVNFA
jgi:hypothetical protein